MALVNCPECKNEVSDQSSAFIKCGYPIKGKPQNVMISFPTVEGQLFNNICKVLRIGIIPIIPAVLCFIGYAKPRKE